MTIVEYINYLNDMIDNEDDKYILETYYIWLGRLYCIQEFNLEIPKELREQLNNEIKEVGI